jgi:putative endonuclease
MAMAGELAKRRGEAAERLAERHLLAAGLRVIARNYRCRAGELDLICAERGTLVVVEVRQRSGRDFGGPLASVGRLKQRRIMLTTEFFRMHSRQWTLRPVRFDVVAVLGSPDTEHELIWIKDAFRT